MTARISFAELQAYIDGDASGRAPLDALVCSTDHVHGLLEIEVSGVVLPRMGFWGPTDVCFNTWIEALSQIVVQLGTNESATYTLDEGEQGMPAFVFERVGTNLYVSVADSLLSGAAGDPTFQCISCSWTDFRAAVEEFFSSFRVVLNTQSPLFGPAWWQKALGPAEGEPKLPVAKVDSN